MPPRPKKRYQVIKATKRDIPGILVGGERMDFGTQGAFEVTDPGKAAEIDKVLGHKKGTGEVVVTSSVDREAGHKYTFGSSQAYADAWEQMLLRRENKKKQANPGAKARRSKRGKANDQEAQATA